MSFVDLYLKYTAESESPARYLYWSALGSIAAIVRDNVYLPRQYNKTFANIFVLFVGPSGMRKSFPVYFAEDMIREVGGTKIFSGRASIQGIVHRLHEAVTDESGGPPIKGAAGIILASEFANSLISDETSLTQLTDLYDGNYHKVWEYTLKGTGLDSLNQPCLSMIGASNEENLDLILQDNSIRGGFLARTVIVYESGLTKINPMTKVTPEPFPKTILYDQIHRIADLKGEFSWTEDGAKLYEEWYTPFRRNVAASRDSTGTLDRLHETIVKVAMLISVSRGSDLLLTPDDVYEAIQACKNYVSGNRRIAMGLSGKAVSAPGTAAVIKALLSQPDMAMAKSELLAENWQHFDLFELDRILESLSAQNGIRLPLLVGKSGKREAFIVLTPDYAKKYKTKSNGHHLEEAEEAGSEEKSDDTDTSS
jgi:hypothetical protein